MLRLVRTVAVAGRRKGVVYVAEGPHKDGSVMCVTEMNMENIHYLSSLVKLCSAKLMISLSLSLSLSLALSLSHPHTHTRTHIE